MHHRLYKNPFRSLVLAFAAALLLGGAAAAQTTAFNYQGRLTESGNPPTGTFQMQFKLFDAVTAGNQIGTTLDNPSVAVNQGIFTMSLNFGANTFSGADRYLEISVRHNSSESYTTLSPRQQIASSPYSIRTISAQQADVALDANKLGGVDASQYVTNATLSANVIRNQTSQQASANFNISGNGIIGGNLGIGTSTPVAGLDLRGNGFAAQQRITDNASGNSLVLQAGAGGNMKITGFNYGSGTAQPLFLSTDGANTILNPSGGIVGIGTASPSASFKLDVVGFGGVRAFDNGAGSANFVAETSGGTNSWARYYMRTTNQSWLIGTSQAFNGDQLYIANGPRGAEAIKMAIYPNGNVGIGTTNPLTNLHVVGSGVVESGVQSLNERALLSLNSTLSGQNRVWTIENGIFGTPGLFGIYDRTANRAPLTIDTNGKIQTNGNMTQDVSKYGLPKAMLFVQANGTIVRCYNGVTGATTNGCGFSVSTFHSGNEYLVDFGFDVTARFASVTSYATVDTGSSPAFIVARSYRAINDPPTVLRVFTFYTVDGGTGDVVSDFFIIVY